MLLDVGFFARVGLEQVANLVYTEFNTSWCCCICIFPHHIVQFVSFSSGKTHFQIHQLSKHNIFRHKSDPKMDNNMKRRHIHQTQYGHQHNRQQ